MHQRLCRITGNSQIQSGGSHSQEPRIKVAASLGYQIQRRQDARKSPEVLQPGPASASARTLKNPASAAPLQRRGLLAAALALALAPRPADALSLKPADQYKELKGIVS
ncbi:hypothetical protein WJX84_009522, partial [Apatococcus fuscideae]